MNDYEDAPWNARLPRRDPETGFYDDDDDDEEEPESDELRCERCGEVVTAFSPHSDEPVCADCAGWDTTDTTDTAADIAQEMRWRAAR